MTTYAEWRAAERDTYESACAGWGCVDGCGDCVQAAFEQSERELGERIGYPALVYHQEKAQPADDVQADLDRLEALVDRHGDVTSLLARADSLEHEVRAFEALHNQAINDRDAFAAENAQLRARVALLERAADAAYDVLDDQMECTDEDDAPALETAAAFNLLYDALAKAPEREEVMPA